jgi:hypothetical protein
MRAGRTNFAVLHALQRNPLKHISAAAVMRMRLAFGSSTRQCSDTSGRRIMSHICAKE